MSFISLYTTNVFIDGSVTKIWLSDFRNIEKLRFSIWYIEMFENEHPEPSKGDIGKLRFPEYFENIYILIVFLKISCHRYGTVD